MRGGMRLIGYGNIVSKQVLTSGLVLVDASETHMILNVLSIP